MVPVEARRISQPAGKEFHCSFGSDLRQVAAAKEPTLAQLAMLMAGQATQRHKQPLTLIR